MPIRRMKARGDNRLCLRSEGRTLNQGAALLELKRKEIQANPKLLVLILIQR
jgi:hypothetical protein